MLRFLSSVEPEEAADVYSMTGRDSLHSLEDVPVLPMPSINRSAQFSRLLRREILQELPVVMSWAQIAQYVTISILIGWMFMEVGSSSSQRDLRELVSLCFYTTTLWTFTPLYGAIVRMRDRMQQDQGYVQCGPLVVGSGNRRRLSA